MIEVIFYKANKATKHKWLSRLIAWWTKGKYSHVEIVIDGEMYSSSNWDGGVRKKKFKGLNEKWNSVLLTNLDKKKIKEFYELTKNNKYDYLGVFGFIIPFKDREKQWFCSEWVSNALKIAGYKSLWTKEPSKISPNRLFEILTKGE